jgi:hypothetical protein
MKISRTISGNFFFSKSCIQTHSYDISFIFNVTPSLVLLDFHAVSTFRCLISSRTILNVELKTRFSQIMLCTCFFQKSFLNNFTSILFFSCKPKYSLNHIFFLLYQPMHHATHGKSKPITSMSCLFIFQKQKKGKSKKIQSYTQMCFLLFLLLKTIYIFSLFQK